jgi:hypothetical protein
MKPPSRPRSSIWQVSMAAMGIARSPGTWPGVGTPAAGERTTRNGRKLTPSLRSRHARQSLVDPSAWKIFHELIERGGRSDARSLTLHNTNRLWLGSAGHGVTLF